MQNILPVLCFIAGFALAWLVVRPRRRETESAFRALSAEALAHNQQAVAETVAQAESRGRPQPEPLTEAEPASPHSAPFPFTRS